MKVFAKFDEIPSMILEVIKEQNVTDTLSVGRSVGRTTWKQYTLPQTQFAGGINTKNPVSRIYCKEITLGAQIIKSSVDQTSNCLPVDSRLGTL